MASSRPLPRGLKLMHFAETTRPHVAKIPQTLRPLQQVVTNLAQVSAQDPKTPKDMDRT